MVLKFFKICNNENDYIFKIGSVLEMLFVWLFVIVLLVVIVVFFGGFLLFVFVRFLDWLWLMWMVIYLVGFFWFGFVSEGGCLIFELLIWLVLKRGLK